MPLTVTFIRHGESQDNIKTIWAGWKDAPLSELGERQAKALGSHFSETKTHLTALYASPLQRAHQTAQAVQQAHPGDLPITLNPDLREQHFGVAEGHPWTYEVPQNATAEELYAEGIFPVLFERDEKFPQGESLNELRDRASRGLRECVLKHLEDAKDDHLHVGIASHGLCIGELVAALVRLDPDADHERSYTGLKNTAWTRAVISLKSGHEGSIDPHNPPPLDIKVTHINNASHLVNLPAVPKPADKAASAAQAFFGGEVPPPTAATNAGNTEAKF